MTTWSPEMIATLRALWHDRDLSARDLAERLDVTPAAVSSMAHRLGLPSRYPNRGRGSTHQKCRRTGAKPFRIAAAPSAPSPLPPPPAAILSALARTEPHARCRWPLWGWAERPGASPRFCNAPTAQASPYCPIHAELAIRRRGEPWRKAPVTLLARLLAA